MQRLLLALTLLCGTFLGSAQTYKNIVVQVLSGGVHVPNHAVWVETYSNGNAIPYRSGYTDSMQHSNYGDSISTSMTFDSLKTYTYDCNGAKIYGVAGAMPSGIFGFHDTISISCPLNAFAGKVNLLYSQSSNQANIINFVDTTVGSGISGTTVWRNCFFGDNDSAVVSSSFSHTYPGPGKYYMTFLRIESNSQGFVQTSTFSDTVEVLPFNPPTFCQATYSVDTVNSGNGYAFIYNNSTPSVRDTNYTTTYHWDFGDGDTSNLPFPTHTYSNAGAYAVCLTAISIDSVGVVCTSKFCDTLGIDSVGNLIHKNSGFTLVIQDSTTIGADEFVMRTDAEIYPNPFSNRLHVNSGSGNFVSYGITDLKGSAILKKGFFNGKETRHIINLEGLQKGIYILHLTDVDGRLSHFQIVKH
ncbi:PKD domain-containing protein [Owenweeksia hongkongensis]|uniref:PKD domain-containing protein n=1 Tax=Owenweeksia hongkongensis TaxID=253245 RepID=UPI003A928003